MRKGDFLCFLTAKLIRRTLTYSFPFPMNTEPRHDKMIPLPRPEKSPEVSRDPIAEMMKIARGALRIDPDAYRYKVEVDPCDGFEKED